MAQTVTAWLDTRFLIIVAMLTGVGLLTAVVSFQVLRLLIPKREAIRLSAVLSVSATVGLVAGLLGLYLLPDGFFGAHTAPGAQPGFIRAYGPVLVIVASAIVFMAISVAGTHNWIWRQMPDTATETEEL